MKLAIGCDHAGVAFKEQMKEFLKELGHETVDFGTDTTDSVDYSDIAVRVCDAVLTDCDRGILICGTGIGMSIAANKIKGIRAALCSDPYSAQMTKRHNDSNVITLGARVTGIDLGKEIVRAYLNAEFDGGRHARRLEKVMALEER